MYKLVVEFLSKFQGWQTLNVDKFDASWQTIDFLQYLIRRCSISDVIKSNSFRCIELNTSVVFNNSGRETEEGSKHRRLNLESCEVASVTMDVSME